MKKYLNKHGNSGVSHYELEPGGIRVKFTNGNIYYYSVAITGLDNINEMKKLAQNGKGLSTFISQVIKENYALKEN